MAFVHVSAREIHCKIVYYGPGLGGKTANLEHIFDRVDPASRGKMISLKTDSDRTLFFDFLPISIGNVRGHSVRLQLYTVPGQVFYEASRRLLLRGVDGVVFVADSQPTRQDANLESLENLEGHLRANGFDPARMPTVLQYNKRDMEDAMPVEALRASLNRRNAPEHLAVARHGEGVFETLKSISRAVLRTFSHEVKR